MVNRLTLVGATALLSQRVLAGLYPGLSTDNHTCTLQTPVLSCSSGAVPGLVDTCCTETFGGLVLSTQFWDTYTGRESSGQLLPRDTWTLHGMWLPEDVICHLRLVASPVLSIGDIKLHSLLAPAESMLTSELLYRTLA